MIKKRNNFIIIFCIIFIFFLSRLCFCDNVFEDVTEKMGLVGGLPEEAAWGDFNNDGWVDIYVSGILWRNDGGKRFIKMEGLPSSMQGEGLWGDFDNDGYLDLYSFYTHKLFRNIKGKTFVDVSEKLPPSPIGYSRGAAWGDFNGDGYLDLYVSGYEASFGGEIYPDVIFRNEAGKSFTEVWRTKKEMLQSARGVTACDFDEDGDLDIYVSNYRLFPNLLWRNDGKGIFEEVAELYGVAGDGDLGAWGHTIGSAWGDFDNDGHFDLFVGNFSHPAEYQDRPKFLKNLGEEGGFRFKDLSSTAGLRWQESYASPALGDFDNDGFLDLFLTTIYTGDTSVLYRNNGDWTFTDVTKGSNIGDVSVFYRATPQTYKAAWADYDNDGYLDLVSGGSLFRNTGGGNYWLKVRLEGVGRFNRSAIGAQVRIRSGERILVRQVEAGTGEGNQNDLTLHFGLGNQKGPMEMEIRWTDGTKQKMTVRKVNRLITVGKKTRMRD